MSGALYPLCRADGLEPAQERKGVFGVASVHLTCLNTHVDRTEKAGRLSLPEVLTEWN